MLPCVCDPLPKDMTEHETQIMRATMMREMPPWLREPAIRGGVRIGAVIDARERFRGVSPEDASRQAAIDRVRKAGIFRLLSEDLSTDGDIA